LDPDIPLHYTPLLSQGSHAKIPILHLGQRHAAINTDAPPSPIIPAQALQGHEKKSMCAQRPGIPPEYIQWMHRHMALMSGRRTVKVKRKMYLGYGR